MGVGGDSQPEGPDADPASWSGARVEALRCPPTARFASICNDFGRLVVLGDSLCFHGPEGPVPLSEARVYPNILGQRLEVLTGRPWVVDVWARAGWGVRELWLALQKDVHLQQQLLMQADAVVLAVGSADQLSVAVPRWVMMALPYLRPTSLRREVRRRIDHMHPQLTLLTRGRFPYTPPEVIEHCWNKSVDALRLFAGDDIPLVAVLPPFHQTVYYGGVTRHHDRTHRLLTELSEEREVAMVDLAGFTRNRLGELNVDGAHWSWQIHQDVGAAMAGSLAAQISRRPHHRLK